MSALVKRDQQQYPWTTTVAVKIARKLADGDSISAAAASVEYPRHVVAQWYEWGRAGKRPYVELFQRVQVTAWRDDVAMRIAQMVKEGVPALRAAKIMGLPPKELKRWMEQGAAGIAPYARFFQAVSTAEEARAVDWHKAINHQIKAGGDGRLARDMLKDEDPEVYAPLEAARTKAQIRAADRSGGPALEVNVTNNTTNVEKQLQLPTGALAELGAMAAKLMTQQRQAAALAEESPVDAEVVPP